LGMASIGWIGSFDSTGCAATNSGGRAATAVHERNEIAPIAMQTSTPPSNQCEVPFLAKFKTVRTRSLPSRFGPVFCICRTIRWTLSARMKYEHAAGSKETSGCGLLYLADFTL
jgi:hypothetical protein